MKKIFSLLLVTVLVISIFIGCKSSDKEKSSGEKSEISVSKTETNGEERIVIGVAMLDMTQEFFVNMIEGGDAAAKEYDIDLIWKSADSNLDKQIALIENFIEQGVKCILVDPYDSIGLIPVCEKAQEAGIPVISMGNYIDSPAVTSNLYNDYEDTKLVSQFLAKLIDEEGELGFLYGAAGNFVSDERQRGFEDAMKEFPNIRYTSLPVGWDTATTLKVTQDLLASNPDIKGIHSFSDGNTIAVYQGVDQAGRAEDLLITSYDGNKDASQAVLDGKYVCTILTGAKRVGYWNVKLGVELAKGNELAQKNYLKSHLVLSDKYRGRFEEWGLGYEGLSIITPEEAIVMFDDVTIGFD